MMAGPSKIEWTEQTWNPIVGCSIVSPGCTNCYAMRDAWRKHHNPKLSYYHGLTKQVNGNAVWTGVVRQAPEHILLEPLKRRKPTVYFVNSMSDLFHESIPDEWIDPVFAVMALCPQHTFQVLTKRQKRMREYIAGPYKGDGVCARIADATWSIAPTRKQLPEPPIFIEVPVGPRLPTGEPEFGWRRMMKVDAWPLPNVWLGTSCERQQEADERIPLLLQTPAAIRFLSLEPLLGPIDLPWMRLGGRTPIDWVIVGGESGPNAKPMHPDWARSLRDQCAVASVPFFFKQWGEWAPGSLNAERVADIALDRRGEAAGHIRSLGEMLGVTGMSQVGKKRAGRLLDGRTHDAFPSRPTRPGTP